MKLKISSVIIVLVLLTFTGASCIQDNSSIVPAEVSVISKELKKDAAGKTVLLVSVKNTGRIKADVVEVAAKYYDAQKNLLDANRDSVMTLNPGETWDFTLPCSSDINKVASYEVTVTTGSGGD